MRGDLQGNMDIASGTGCTAGLQARLSPIENPERGISVAS